MRITLSSSKSVQDNANHFFEKAKKMKKKIEGARASIGRLKLELGKVESKREQILQEYRQRQAKRAVPRRQLHWFEKFRWFRSSDGVLCIGGRDATSNEVVVKKHSLKGDLVFHTEAPGSPFFVAKAEGKLVPEQTRLEAAQAAASYSKAWKMGISAVEAYYVDPDQLSKTPNTGEYLSKGAFVVRGKRNHIKAELALSVGVTEDGLVMGGPREAVRKHCAKRVDITLGDDKPSDAAKKMAKILGVEVDDVLRVLPSGNIKVLQ